MFYTQNIYKNVCQLILCVKFNRKTTTRIYSVKRMSSNEPGCLAYEQPKVMLQNLTKHIMMQWLIIFIIIIVLYKVFDDILEFQFNAIVYP